MENVTEITRKNPDQHEPLPAPVDFNLLPGTTVPYQRATILTFVERQALKSELAREGKLAVIDFAINLHQRVLYLENAIDIMTNAAGSTPPA